MTSLQGLYLGDNLLHGVIPGSFGRFTDLKQVYSGGNEWSGCLPRAWQELETTGDDFRSLGLGFCSDFGYSTPLLSEPRTTVYYDTTQEEEHSQGLKTFTDSGVMENTECAPGRFCSEQSLQRWVMAVWLVGDIAGNPHAGYINALEAAGIVQGCTTRQDLYCPDMYVTRAQMVNLLHKVKMREVENSA